MEQWSLATLVRKLADVKSSKRLIGSNSSSSLAMAAAGDKEGG